MALEVRIVVTLKQGKLATGRDTRRTSGVLKGLFLSLRSDYKGVFKKLIKLYIYVNTFLCECLISITYL